MTESHPEITLADLNWLTALARTLVQDGSAADDLVQQAWVSATESPPRDGEVNRAWLSRVLKNLHLNSLRSGTRRTRREQVVSKPEATPSTAELVERMELRRTLADCLLTLDEPYRRTLMLVVSEGYTARQISEREGVSVGVVRHRLRKARELYKQKLERDHGGDWSKWYAALLPYARLPLPAVDGPSASSSVTESAASQSSWVKPTSPAGVTTKTAAILAFAMSATGLLTTGLTLGTGAFLYFFLGGENAPSGLQAPVESVSTPDERQAKQTRPQQGELARVSTPTEGGVSDPSAPTTTAPAEPLATATLVLRILSPSADWIAAVMGDQPAFLDDGEPSWWCDAEAGPDEKVWTLRHRHDVESGKGLITVRGSSTGVYTFTNVLAGVPFRVAAMDSKFFEAATLANAPLQPGETRVVDLTVESLYRDFTGRVVSDTGVPIAGASIQVSQFGDANSTGNSTDAEGQFSLGGIGVDELVVAVRADGWAHFIDTRFRVPNNGPAEIVLEKGRDVQLEVLTSSGERLRKVGVYCRLPGAGISAFDFAYIDDTGRGTLEQVPMRQLPLEVKVDGRVWRDTLPFGITDHQIVLPDWQTCRVRVSGADGATRSLKIRVGLRPAVPEGWEVETQWLDLEADEVVFPKVFPGTYEVFLERARNGRPPWIGAPVKVEVTDGEPGAAKLRV